MGGMAASCLTSSFHVSKAAKWNVKCINYHFPSQHTKQLERGFLKSTEAKQNGMNEAGELGMKGLKMGSGSGGEKEKSEEKKRHGSFKAKTGVCRSIKTEIMKWSWKVPSGTSMQNIFVCFWPIYRQRCWPPVQTELLDLCSGSRL